MRARGPSAGPRKEAIRGQGAPLGDQRGSHQGLGCSLRARGQPIELMGSSVIAHQGPGVPFSGPGGLSQKKSRVYVLM